MDSNLKTFLIKKSENFLETNLIPPSNKQLKQWAEEKLKNNYSTKIEQYLKEFRRSLPTVSQRIPDGHSSWYRKKNIGQTFSSPTWISADIGYRLLKYLK